MSAAPEGRGPGPLAAGPGLGLRLAAAAMLVVAGGIAVVVGPPPGPPQGTPGAAPTGAVGSQSDAGRVGPIAGPRVVVPGQGAGATAPEDAPLEVVVAEPGPGQVAAVRLRRGAQELGGLARDAEGKVSGDALVRLPRLARLAATRDVPIVPGPGADLELARAVQRVLAQHGGLRARLVE